METVTIGLVRWADEKEVGTFILEGDFTEFDGKSIGEFYDDFDEAEFFASSKLSEYIVKYSQGSFDVKVISVFEE